MIKIDIIKELSLDECEKIYEEHICPKCHKELKINYYESDGGSWDCENCGIEYWVVF